MTICEALSTVSNLTISHLFELVLKKKVLISSGVYPTGIKVESYAIEIIAALEKVIPSGVKRYPHFPDVTFTKPMPIGGISCLRSFRIEISV